MSLPYDADFEAFVAPIYAAHPPPPSATGGDAANAHKNLDPLFEHVIMPQFADASPGVKTTTISIPAADGHQITVYVNQPPTESTSPQPAIIYTHGGGFIACTAQICQPFAASLAALTNRPVFNVEYRLAPQHPFPTPLNDSYAALQYVRSHAAELNVDSARIALYGESAGGNLVIALGLKARDEKLSPPVAAVVAAYPMLDDRTTVAKPEGMREKLMWKELDNKTAWLAYLGSLHGKDDVPYLAAPARAKDLSGLPPIYIDVGGLDLFLAEDVDFAARLLAAGNQTELHVFPGVPHAYELTAPGVPVSKATIAARKAALTRF